MKKRTDNFDKFANPKKGSAIKEAFRQEKKKIKLEARAAGEEMRRKKIEKMRGITPEPENKPAAPRGKGPKRESTKYEARGTKDGARTGTKHEARSTSRPVRSTGAKDEARTSTKDEGRGTNKREAGGREQNSKPQTPNPKPQTPNQNPSFEQMPLNKFIAHAGVCGRREAAELVKEGKVTVNGDKIFEPGYKVTGAEKVIVKGKQVFLQKNAVYILLNKPKDFITTSNDPQGRKTVLDLVKHATAERIYPVGRLDRNTTGVLLLTNDGELAQKLTHPSFEVKKIYEVTLDKPVTKKDLESIVSGITLEDGLVQADAVGYADPKDRHVVGIEIHSGRNRIVRRIFEHLGYEVKALDRVMFANLTKKNVDRSKWRFLNEKEVRLLKFMNKSFLRKSKEPVTAEADKGSND
ncbi:MAG: ribosomal large subunit pseudouridine synthase [Sediminibacterium sp.]|nr:ribosomal large subunit pseudouridine synthase [Sediminibacterium sp.]